MHEARTNSRRSRQLSSEWEASAPASTGWEARENLEKKLGSNAAISQTDPVTSGEPPAAGGKGDSRVLNLVSVYLFRILRQGSLSPQLELCLPWWQCGIAEQG